MTRNSIERLDGQMGCLKTDVNKLSDQVKMSLTLLQKLCNANSVKSPKASSVSSMANLPLMDATHSCDAINDTINAIGSKEQMKTLKQSPLCSSQPSFDVRKARSGTNGSTNSINYSGIAHFSLYILYILYYHRFTLRYGILISFLTTKKLKPSYVAVLSPIIVLIYRRSYDPFLLLL